MNTNRLKELAGVKLLNEIGLADYELAMSTFMRAVEDVLREASTTGQVSPRDAFEDMSDVLRRKQPRE